METDSNERIYDRGVATGWTGVDMSTPLFPKVIPEIDTNLMSFYSGGGSWGRSKYGEWSKFAAFVGHRKL